MTIHNTTSAVTMTRAECQSAANVLQGLADVADATFGDAAQLSAAAEALQGLLDGFTHLVLREKD